MGPRNRSFKDFMSERLNMIHIPRSISHAKVNKATKLEEYASQPGFMFCRRDFELLKQIGSGAFGVVKLCRYLLTDEVVVIKVLSKKHIIKTGQQAHIMDEKEAMFAVSRDHCPFTVKTLGAFSDESNLYFVMEYVSGGELFAHLKSAKNHRFSEKRARFYIAELIIALNYMHIKEHIVYRDIKPENCLVDSTGHLKLIDFGFAKHLEEQDRTYTFCGTTDYLAPEVITGEGYNKEADYWSLGVFIYELVVGYPPFETIDCRGKLNYKNILSGQLTFPTYLTPACKDLICGLLTVSREYRLGYKRGMQEVMKHQWFATIDWEHMERGEAKAPKPHKYKKGLCDLYADKTVASNTASSSSPTPATSATHSSHASIQLLSSISSTNTHGTAHQGTQHCHLAATTKATGTDIGPSLAHTNYTNNTNTSHLSKQSCSSQGSAIDQTAFLHFDDSLIKADPNRPYINGRTFSRIPESSSSSTLSSIGDKSGKTKSNDSFIENKPPTNTPEHDNQYPLQSIFVRPSSHTVQPSQPHIPIKKTASAASLLSVSSSREPSMLKSTKKSTTNTSFVNNLELLGHASSSSIYESSSKNYKSPVQHNGNKKSKEHLLLTLNASPLHSDDDSSYPPSDQSHITSAPPTAIYKKSAPKKFFLL